MPQYDYIITGAGCAGLSLLMRMIDSGHITGKKILLVDKAAKTQNDRTWCFWEKEPGFFEPVVYRQWNKLSFFGVGYDAVKDTAPYRYKMIRGIDLYNYCFERINQQSNITVLYGEVEKIHSDPSATFITINGKDITADYVFNSILFEKPVLQKKAFYLLQHFKGWIIDTAKPVFNPGEATLMDFRVSQQEGTCFVYVMPFSPSQALVEYTLFSESLQDAAAYDTGLKQYIRDNLKIDEYKIQDEEFGVIPMTNCVFPASEHHIIHIGTAGGQTKASSGYTFRFIQKQADAIVRSLIENGKPGSPKNKKRFHFYDSVLLNVLATGKLSGDKVFTDLFSRNRLTDIFAFLDNESSLMQDVRIISSLPVKPFLRAASQQL